MKIYTSYFNVPGPYVVNEQLLPSPITKQTILQMAKKILGYIHSSYKVLKPFDLSSVNIEISNEMPTEYYPGLSLSTIIEMILSLEPDLRRRLEECEDINDVKRKIKDFPIREENIKKVREIINSGEGLSVSVCSSYDYDTRIYSHHIFNVNCYNKRIILYIKNIQASTKEYGGLENAIESSLAYQVFNSLMHTYVEDTKHCLDWIMRKDYLAKVFKEGTLSYFTTIYSEAMNIPVVKNHMKYSILVYPRAFEKYYRNPADFDFIMPLITDKPMEQLFKELLEDDYLFYLVLNRRTLKFSTQSSKRPKIILYPSDVDKFKAELLKQKRAIRILIFKSGKVEVDSWNASKFTSNSDVYGNIKTSGYYRNMKDELEKVVIIVL